jgi:hypothetical protein
MLSKDLAIDWHPSSMPLSVHISNAIWRMAKITSISLVRGLGPTVMCFNIAQAPNKV